MQMHPNDFLLRCLWCLILSLLLLNYSYDDTSGLHCQHYLHVNTDNYFLTPYLFFLLLIFFFNCHAIMVPPSTSSRGGYNSVISYFITILCLSVPSNTSRAQIKHIFQIGNNLYFTIRWKKPLKWTMQYS